MKKIIILVFSIIILSSLTYSNIEIIEKNNKQLYLISEQSTLSISSSSERVNQKINENGNIKWDYEIKGTDIIKSSTKRKLINIYWCDINDVVFHAPFITYKNCIVYPEKFEHEKIYDEETKEYYVRMNDEVKRTSLDDYTLQVSYPDDYDPFTSNYSIRTINNIPIISEHYIVSIPEGNSSYSNWTSYFTATDDDNDELYNFSWFNTTNKNLVAYYPLNLGSPEEISNNLDGTMDGFITYNGELGSSDVGDAAEPQIVDGKFGRGVYFDGDDYISTLLKTPNTFSVINEPFSICAWIIRTSDAQGSIFSNDLTSSNNRSIRFQYVNGYIQLVTYNSGTLTPSQSVVSTNITLNKSIYACGVYEAENYSRIYIDGKLNASTSRTFNGYYSGNGFFNVGALFNGASYSTFHKGLMDNLVYYPCNLSQTMIQRNMNSPYPIDFTSDGGCAPVLSYSFENFNTTHTKDTNYLINTNQNGAITNNMGGYKFNGNEYVLITGSEIFNLSNTAHFSAWVNLYENINLNNYILRLRNDSNELAGIIIGYLRGIKCIRSGLPETKSYALTLGLNTKIDCWYNSTSMKIYINGIFLNETTGTSTIMPTPTTVVIGGDSSSNKTISQVKLFDYIPSDSQIYENYLADIENRTARLMSDETSVYENWRSNIIVSDYSDYSSSSSYIFYISENISDLFDEYKFDIYVILFIFSISFPLIIVNKEKDLYLISVFLLIILYFLFIKINSPYFSITSLLIASVYLIFYGS